MADIALSKHLIDEYLKFKFQEPFNREKIRRLFKYIQPFAVKKSYFDDPALAMPMENDPLIEIIDDCTDEDLVQMSILKIMLIDSFIEANFVTLNIMGLTQKLSVRYSGIYNNRLEKDVAQAHIKALLSDASWVKITDKYIAANRSWKQNKAIIKDIVPHDSFDLTIVGAENDRDIISQTEKDELNAICSNWSIKANRISNDVHDRYIETNKVKILLSSGLYNLSVNSNKDFTYVVEIK